MYSEKKEVTARLIAEGERLGREYDTARRKLEAARPEIDRFQADCIVSVMHLQSTDHTTSRDFPETIFKEYQADARQQFQAALAARDALAIPLAQEADRAKNALFQFHARIIGKFSSWGQQATSKLPSDHILTREFKAARQKLEGDYFAPTKTILATIRQIVDKFEGYDFEAPLFRLPALPADNAA